MGRVIAFGFCCLGALAAPPAQAAEKVVMGIVGGLNAFVWPAVIAQAKGFYAQHNVAPDIIFIPSSPAMLQQVAAGSLDVANSAGLVDPIRLVARNAGIAIGRVELHVSPYVLMSKAQFPKIGDLKGKTIAIGSRNDITFVLIEKMLAPSKLTTEDVDLMYSGSTVSRYAALKTGAFDATLLAPPLNYVAEGEGFKQLGIAGDFAKDLPFTGSIINRAWADAHPQAAKDFFATKDQAVEWLYDPKNRDEAIKLLVDASKGTLDDATRSYDFLVGGDYFDRSRGVSRKGVAALIAALHDIGDKEINPKPEDTVIAGLTPLVD
jgi:ABC-type nitrate/sulfonate/bicarbonate transport system substrate-binding protein